MASEVTRRAAKAIALFSSMQMVQVVCAMIRGKIVSAWLGPVGFGLFGLYQGAVDMVGSLSQMGIRTSAVKDIAASAASPSRLGVALAVVRRFGLWLGVAGMLLMILFSWPLSEWSFGTGSRWPAFCLLGVVLFFQSLTNAEQAAFQGLRELKPLARAGVWGAIGGLLLSIPLYRFCGLNGVGPSLIAYAVAIWLPLRLMRRRVRTHLGPEASIPGLSAAETLRQGMGFMKVGFYLTLSAIIGYFINYAFMAFMVREAGQAGQGIYQAGYTMLWRYVAMLFVSVGYEYYPRLAAARSPRRMQPMVSHQALFLSVIMFPCACAAISVAPLLVTLLYDSDFLATVPYFVIGMAGMMFRPLSLSMSYVFLACGKGSYYCLTEVASNVVGLALNVVGFMFWGYAGLGMALIAWQAIDLVIVWLCYRRMEMKLSPRAIAINVLLFALTAICAVFQLRGLWLISAIIALAALLPAFKILRSSRKSKDTV